MTQDEARTWLTAVRREYLQTDDEAYEDFLANWYDELQDWLGAKWAETL
jgi:rhamnogalacturonyl hydrolase YesR